MDGKDIADTSKLVKEFVHCSLVWGSSNSHVWQDHIWLAGNEPDERSPWGGKMIGKLLLTVTVADPQRLDRKGKPVMYTGAFVEIYNWRSRGLVHETHGMVKLEKYPISRAEKPLNLGGQRFYKISEVLQSAHVVPKDTEGNTFYLNNYIDYSQFNHLYDLEWQTKETQSANAIVQKLMPASKKAIEQRQAARERAAQMKKTLGRRNSGLSNQHKHDDYDTNELKNS